MRLYLFECKKILLSKTNLLLLVIFSLISIWMFNVNVKENRREQIQYYNNGQLMSDKEVLQEEALAKKRWTGIMDETWWQDLTKAYEESRIKTTLKFYDDQKMSELYGADWIREYLENSKNYVSLESQEVEDGKRILIPREVPLLSTKEDIASNVAWDIYMNYGEIIMKNKPWNSEDGTFGIMYSGMNGEAVAAPVYSDTTLSKEEILLLKDTMNDIDSFYYGDTKNWSALLETLATSGILLLLWVILVSSDLINKERKHMMMEIQRTCVNGKTRLFVIKLGAVFTCGLVGLLGIVGGVSLYALLSGGIGDGIVNVIESIYLVSIFNYNQAFMIGIVMMVLGVFVIGTIGCFISTFSKSSYISLAITIVFLFILPSLLNLFGDISHLMPANFMNITNVSVRSFSVMFLNKPYLLYRLLPVLWLFINSLLIGVAWLKYRSKKYSII